MKPPSLPDLLKPQRRLIFSSSKHKMKLHHLLLLLCFYWITTANIVTGDDEDSEADYSEDEEEKPTNDYCYDAKFECPSVPDVDQCDQAIVSLCDMIKPMMYGAEPMQMEMDKPLKANISVRGICHACRFGKTSNTYVNEKFRRLQFGLHLPALNIVADAQIKLKFINKKMTVLANCSYFSVRLAVDVCDKNISHSQMKECNIDQSGKQQPTCTLGFIERGQTIVLPKMFSDSIMKMVISMIPKIVPKFMQKDIAMIGMIGGCPMTGGPS